MQGQPTVRHPPPRKHAPSGANPLRRSASRSLFSTLKNVVTAPLAWFASTEFEEDASGKRRRVHSSPVPEEGDDEARVRTKRMRVDSPEGTEMARSYTSTSSNASMSDAPWSGSSTKRDVEMDGMGRSNNHEAGVILNGHRHARTASPFSATVRASGALTRTMSMDPPQQLLSRMDTARSHYGPMSRLSLSGMGDSTRTMSMDPPTRRGSMMDISGSSFSSIEDDRRSSMISSMPVIREQSTPFRAPFRMRTSLTPQPSGGSLRSTPQGRESTPYRPPPLDDLMSNPMFVRRSAPPETSENMHQQTLGELLESSKSASPLKQSFSWSTQGPSALADVVNTGRASRQPHDEAERALHELELYRTPLLPSRLKGSSTIPEMFRTKEVRRPTMSKRADDQSPRPRLGMQSKTKSKESSGRFSAKPYAGESSLKKLLARRRQEADQETGNGDVRLSGEKKEIGIMANPEEEAVLHDVPTTPAATVQPAEPVSAPSRISSLRVGHVRTARLHDSKLARPSKPGRPNRFSAAEPEEEEVNEERERELDELRTAAAKAPAFNLPANLTFQNPPQARTGGLSEEKAPGSVSGVQPLAAGTFSKALHAPTETLEPPRPVNVSQEPAAVARMEDSITPFSSMSSVFPSQSAPHSPSAPLPLKAADSAETPASVTPSTNGPVVPNFFSTASVASGAPVLSTPPSGGFWAASSAPLGFKPETTAPPFAFMSTPTTQDNSIASSLFKDGAFGSKAPITSPTAEIVKEKVVFGLPDPSAPAPAASTTVDATPASSRSLTTFTHPQEPKIALVPTGFSLGAGKVPFEKPQSSPAVAADASKDDPKVEPKSPFGTAPTGFTFQTTNGSPVNPTSVSPKTASPFAFGATSASSAETAVGEKTGFTFGRASSNGGSAKFSFGTTTPSLAPAPIFGPGAPPPSSAPTTTPAAQSFGLGSGPATPAASFGAQVSRPATPPKNDDNEMRMDESPTREVKPDELAKPPSSFSFGSAPLPQSTPFGQAGPTTTSSPFTFGAPPSNSSTSSPFSFTGTSFSGTAKALNDAKSTPAPFSFAAPAPPSESTAFSFGQKPAPTLSTSFSFGAKPTESAPTSSTPFSFGQKSTDSTPPNPFGQTVPGTGLGSPATPTSSGGFTFSAANPTAPSLAFGQPTTSFSFGSPSTSVPPTHPFSITTSQTSSPLRTSTDLPGTPTGGGTFTFGAPAPSSTGAQTPTTPTSTPAFSFGVSTSSVTPSFGQTGAPSFSIGAAPSMLGPGGRPLKKLPSRRGTGGKK